MKSQTAAECVAAASLAREGWRPAAGELLICCVADEETGGALGAQWICENHPDEVRCDYLLNEGAGAVLPFDGSRVFGVCIAEKGVFRFRLTTRGVAGHASMPRLGDNALLKLAPLIAEDGRPSADLRRHRGPAGAARRARRDVRRASGPGSGPGRCWSRR